MLQSGKMKTWISLTFSFLFLFGTRNHVIGVSVVLRTGLHFDSGVMYEYEYSTSMVVAPISVEFKEVTAFTMLANIRIHSLWRNSQQEQLLHLQIRDLKLAPNSSDSTSKPFVLGDMASGYEHLKEAFFVHIHSGKIRGVFDVSVDNTLSLNFKKGLTLLLQFQTQPGTIKEDDTTGHCQVSYHISGDDIIRIKHQENCEKRVADGMMFANQFFRVSHSGNSEAVFNMEGNHIKSVISEELRSMVLDEHPTQGIHISSRQFLKVVSTHSGPHEAQGRLHDVLSSLKEGYVNHTIHVIPTVRKPTAEKYSVPKILDYLKSKGLHSQPTTVKMFLQLSESLRKLELAEIEHIFQRSQAKFVPLLIDAAAAASTPASLEALASFIITNPNASPLLEKFLYACAFSSQPSTHLINIITSILTQTSAQWETHEKTLIVLGVVIRKMCAADLCHLQEVEHAKKLIVEGLSASTEEREIKSYLLALKSAHLPETVPVLLQYIDYSKSLSSIVLSALQGFPAQYITTEVKEHARAIFTQRNKSFPAPVRMDAAQLLLMYDPLDIDVREIIVKIAEEKPEVSKFLATKIMNMLQTDYPAKNVIRNVLKDPKLNNYFHLARLGCSSSYAGLMAENKNIAASYDFEFLFSEAGILKQSNSHFYTQTRGRNLHLLQVSLETSGLDTLFGNEATKEAEEEELMAGMSAMFLGVQIQPIVFFQGYSDLMSKYFSAGEGPMNIISGNILVLDHRQSLILQSGLQAQVVFHGGLSVDVSADLAFSLFTQESKTSVNTKFSLVVSARADVDAPLMRTTAETVMKMDPSIRFVTTVSFYDTPVQYCLQLIREPLLYRERVSTRVEKLNRRKLVQQIKQKWTFSAEETALHKDNSKMCRNLLNPNSK